MKATEEGEDETAGKREKRGQDNQARRILYELGEKYEGGDKEKMKMKME